jgi:heptose II phosphotransferase
MAVKERTSPLRFNEESTHMISCLDEACSRELLAEVLEGRIEREQVFRDNWRTLSAQVRFQGMSLLLKIPRARNSRLWERLLTFFRGSDAQRIFRHLSMMSAMGLAAPEPVLACEKRRAGVTTDAFVCYYYVEGRRAEPRDAGLVLEALRKLHGLGYLRTDAQLANFLIRDDAVVFIDFRLKRPWLLPGLKKARELDRFLRSCPEAKRHLTDREASSFWLKIAHALEDASFARRRLKRSIRDRKKLK